MDPDSASHHVRCSGGAVFLRHRQRRQSDVQPPQDVCRTRHFLRLYADYGASFSL